MVSCGMRGAPLRLRHGCPDKLQPPPSDKPLSEPRCKSEFTVTWHCRSLIYLTHASAVCSQSDKAVQFHIVVCGSVGTFLVGCLSVTGMHG